MIIKGLSLIIIMTIKIINNNYYYLHIYIYINELIKMIFKYFRKTQKKFSYSILCYKLIINNK